MEADNEFPEGGIWSHAQWVERVNKGLEKTIVFIPEESMSISINGVMFYTTRGQEIELPMPFYWQYMESRRMVGQGLSNAIGTLEKRSFGPGQTSVTGGWNGNDLG